MSHVFDNNSIAYLDRQAPGSDSRPISRVGISFVEQVVTFQWRCGWQEWDASNDDGIDGLIILRRKGVDTGAIVFAQVKCGDSYDAETLSRPDFVNVVLGETYIAQHLPRWKKLPGPVILIYVKPSEDLAHSAWWVDLRSDEILCPTNKSVVLIPRKNVFNSNTLGEIRGLYKHSAKDRTLPVVNLLPTDRINSLRKPLIDAAKEFYSVAKANPPLHPRLGTIEIGRCGWRHITKRDRGNISIVNTLNLLPAAMRILGEANHWINLGREKRYSFRDSKSGNVLEKKIRLIAVRANLVGKNMAQRTVQVVLMQVTIQAGKIVKTVRYRFYSVHELRRGRIVKY